MYRNFNNILFITSFDQAKVVKEKIAPETVFL